jgi:hypothetical protein
LKAKETVSKFHALIYTSKLLLRGGLVLPAFILLPIGLSAFPLESENNLPGKIEFRAKSIPVTYLNVTFNLVTFFESFKPAYDSDDEKEAGANNEKVDELKKAGFLRGELTGKPGLILKREPFTFLFFEMQIFLIDTKTSTRAIKLNGPVGFLDLKQNNRIFANEVDGVEVEKLNDDTYRIFAQVIGGNGMFGGSPMTWAWDYNFKNNTVSWYDFGFAFAKDLEKKGHRDLVIYDEGFNKNHWRIFGGWVFSWNGKEWIDISDKEKDFLRGLLKQNFGDL